MSGPEDVEALLAEALLPYVHRVCTCQMFDNGPHQTNPRCMTLKVADEAVRAVLPVVVEAQREAVEKAAVWLDDHTSCNCEEGDHLTRLASARTLRRYAATTYPTPKETPCSFNPPANA